MRLVNYFLSVRNRAREAVDSRWLVPRRVHMGMVSRRIVFPCLCILIGYSLFGIFALSLRFPFDVPIEAYWLGFVFVSIPPLCEIVFWGDSPKLRLVYLLSFSLMIHLQYAAVDSSMLLLSQDAIADYRLTEKIIISSGWSSSLQFVISSEYTFYPITNFIYATTSMLTGIPLLLVVKYLFVIKALVVTPIIDKWFKCFFSDRIAYLATQLFLASPGAILFPHKESFAIIFFFLGLYALFKSVKHRQHLLIVLFSVVTLIMTHHFTTYIFLGLLTCIFLAGNVSRRPKTIRVSTRLFMLFWVVFATWVAFVAWTIIVVHQKLVYKMFFEALFPGRLIFSELMPLYVSYERVILNLGFGIAVISAVFGFLGYVRNGKTRSSEFMAISFFLLPLLVVASIFRFYPAVTFGVLISHRIYEFGYIVVGAFSSLFFVRVFQLRRKLTLNLFLACAIALMIIIGPIAGAMHPRTFARLSDVVSYRGASLGAWMSESAPDERAVGDKAVYTAVTGYGDTVVTDNPDFFASDGFSLPLEASYVVTYVYMTDFYGPNAAKFDSSPYFHNIYTNGLLNTYVISNRTSS